jgi:hypothetical protein
MEQANIRHGAGDASRRFAVCLRRQPTAALSAASVPCYLDATVPALAAIPTQFRGCATQQFARAMDTGSGPWLPAKRTGSACSLRWPLGAIM